MKRSLLPLLLLCWTVSLSAQVETRARLLFITHSAGFEHEVIPTAVQTVKELAPLYGIEVTATDDLSLISQEGLSGFDGILFYTTGELPLSDEQKEAFLGFIRSGKGFAGVHSATDTFYDWPEYGELIGAYFDGHPWSGERVDIIIEDLDHRAVKHLGIANRIIDEIYQFRDFDRDDIHVLISLDVTSVDMTKPGIKRKDRDFPLSWTREYGEGRVFYTAFGHFPEVWKSRMFEEHLFNGLLWSMRK